jgi:predicted regulator of Ras-like GTPase activity (Roadblock/LC7/MglB family)
MVDYYLLLSRAVQGIPSSMPGAREALYERARKILAADLARVPTVIEAEFAAEKRALEDAIARIKLETRPEPASAPVFLDSKAEEAQEAATLFIQTPAPQETSKRPTLSELLRRVDDAMKEPALHSMGQSEARVASAPERRAAPARRPALSPDKGKKAEKPVFVRSWGPAPEKEQMVAPPRPRLNLGGASVQQKLAAPDEAALVELLKSFQQRSPGMEASALISKSGRMMASVMAPEMEPVRVAGVTATLFNLCGRAAKELNRGDICEVVVRADRGYAVVIGAGQDAVLLALASESSQLGYILFCMQESIQALEKLL